MKNHNLTASLLSGLLLMTLISCEKEKPLAEAIIGRWELHTVKQVTYEDEVKVSELIVYSKPDEMEIQFAEGGSGIMYTNGNISGVFTWILEGNMVTLTGGTETLEWTVSVDEDTIVWSYTESEVINNVSYKYEYFFTAIRIA
ncbi:MAG: hypothetical protein IQL11_16125 [Bacteroidales bacterium]|nr:hypothetical protein [Bacteroidales bacterium]